MQLERISVTRTLLAGAAMAALYACADAAPRLAGPVSGPMETKSTKTTTTKDSTTTTTTLPTPESATETLIGLTRDVPLAEDIYVEGWIGPLGGSLKIDEAGVALKVPTGRVSAPVLFSIRALKGNLIAYEFGPEGSQFEHKVIIEQDLKGTSWYKRPVDTSLPAGYFAHRDAIDFATGTLSTTEVVETKLFVKSSKLEIPVSHFSGYMVASGRVEFE